MGIAKPVVIGPFPVNFNDPNVLTTGVPLWTPTPGQVIYDMMFDVVTSFAWTGGGTQTGGTFKMGAQTIVDYHTNTLFGAVPSGASYKLQTSLNLFNGVSGGFPFRIVAAATPIVVIMTVDAGSMTAGKVNFYALSS